MSVTVRTMTVPKKRYGKTFFALSAYSADAQNTEEIKAAPSTGSSIYLTKLVVVGHFDGFITIGDGEATNAVETEAMDIVCTAEGTAVVINLDKEEYEIALTAAKSLTFSGSAAGPITIQAWGYVI